MIKVCNQHEPRRYLVFTSAGDRSRLRGWLRGSRNFDLFICYYGNIQGRYRELADFYIQRKGGKFPNFKHVLTELGFSLAGYDAVLILDDDLEISTTSINRLFAIREKYDLWLLQPAFDRRGKLSFPVTRARPWSLLRYTNFVEVTCPLFETSKLEMFMHVYNPVLVGWGVDLWFSELLSDGAEKNKIAVVDRITCINPRDNVKSRGEREIDTLQPLEERKQVWARVRKTHRLMGEAVAKVEYGMIPLPLNVGNVSHSMKTMLLDGAYRIYKVIDNYRCARRLRERPKSTSRS